MKRTVTFNKALNTVMELPLDEQQLLLDIMQKRWSEAHRNEIAENSKSAQELYNSGSLPEQSLNELISDLHSAI